MSDWTASDWWCIGLLALFTIPELCLYLAMILGKKPPSDWETP